VLEGLQAGQRVVVSSQFLIDSEASLRGIEARLNAAPSAEGPRYRTDARIEDMVALSSLAGRPRLARNQCRRPHQAELAAVRTARTCLSAGRLCLP
jgi:hypothetical protein